MRLSCSAFRINNLKYIAKLHGDPRSLGISIAVITAVERCKGNPKVPSSGPKKEVG